ncbi:MAG: class I SAM-dependent methyltransferase [Rudaea sp.]
MTDPLYSPNYKTMWDAKAATVKGAMLAVDGSASEDVLRMTGSYTAQQVNAALALNASDRVLELGCGVGRIARVIAPQVAHWEGADISANMLRVARERLAGLSNVGLTELACSNLKPLRDASYDKAYCIAVFIHMDKEDFYLYLEDMARVLRPGGLFFFDTWTLSSAIGWRRFCLELSQYRDVVPKHRKEVARNQFTHPEEVRLFLDYAGFDIVGEFADSPWLQVVAMRRGGDVQAERERVRKDATRIAYSPLWTELYEIMIHKVLIEGTMTPQQALDTMKDDTRGPEIPLFRAAFIEMWRLRQETWGSVPRG